MFATFVGLVVFLFEFVRDSVAGALLAVEGFELELIIKFAGFALSRLMYRSMVPCIPEMIEGFAERGFPLLS